MDVLLDLRIRQSGNVDLAYLGKINRPGTVDRKLGVEVDLPPNSNQQLVARSKHIVRSNIHFSERRESRRYLPKKAVTVHRQQAAQGAADHQLEVGRGGRSPDGQKPGLLKGRELGLRTVEATLVNDALNPGVYTRGLQARILSGQPCRRTDAGCRPVATCARSPVRPGAQL